MLVIYFLIILIWYRVDFSIAKMKIKSYTYKLNFIENYPYNTADFARSRNIINVIFIYTYFWQVLREIMKDIS